MDTKKNVILNKLSNIERCLKRIRSTYSGNPEDLNDLDVEDIVTLNIQRACQAAIDIAMHICSVRGLGLPQSSGDAFGLLANASLITPAIAEQMEKMVGFRNIAVHDYQAISPIVLASILDRNLVDFEMFSEQIIQIIQL